MCAVVDFEETFCGDLGVPLGGGELVVPQERLYLTEVGSAGQEVGGK